MSEAHAFVERHSDAFLILLVLVTLAVVAVLLFALAKGYSIHIGGIDIHPPKKSSPNEGRDSSKESPTPRSAGLS